MDEMQKRKLLDYIKEEWPEPMENHFTYDLVKNVIDFADSNWPEDIWMAVYHIVNIVPELTAEELTAILEEE